MSRLRRVSRGLETWMLFESWQQTLARNGDFIALHDVASSRRHSFADLQRQLDALPSLPGCRGMRLRRS